MSGVSNEAIYMAYLAGLIDGEGCYHLQTILGSENEKIDHVNIFVGEYKLKYVMTHKPTIQWCARYIWW